MCGFGEIENVWSNWIKCAYLKLNTTLAAYALIFCRSNWSYICIASSTSGVVIYKTLIAYIWNRMRPFRVIRTGTVIHFLSWTKITVDNARLNTNNIIISQSWWWCDLQLILNCVSQVCFRTLWGLFGYTLIIATSNWYNTMFRHQQQTNSPKYV